MKFKFTGQIPAHASALRIAGLTVHRGATVEALTDEAVEALSAHEDFEALDGGEAAPKRRGRPRKAE